MTDRVSGISLPIPDGWSGQQFPVGATVTSDDSYECPAAPSESCTKGARTPRPRRRWRPRAVPPRRSRRPTSGRTPRSPTATPTAGWPRTRNWRRRRSRSPGRRGGWSAGRRSPRRAPTATSSPWPSPPPPTPSASSWSASASTWRRGRRSSTRSPRGSRRTPRAAGRHRPGRLTGSGEMVGRAGRPSAQRGPARLGVRAAPVPTVRRGQTTVQSSRGRRPGSQGSPSAGSTTASTNRTRYSASACSPSRTGRIRSMPKSCAGTYSRAG